MFRVLRHTAVGGILVVEREEGVLLVGNKFEEGVSEESLVEGELVEHLSQRLPLAIGSLHNLAKQRHRGVVVKPLTRDVVRLVVDDAAMGGRATREHSQRFGEVVVGAPAPKLLAFDLCRGEGIERIGTLSGVANQAFSLSVFHISKKVLRLENHRRKRGVVRHKSQGYGGDVVR